MILAGDVGGTKTNLGLYEHSNGTVRQVAFHRFNSRAYSSAEDMVREFMQQTRARVEAACFDCAGPVVEDRVRITNLPWSVEAAGLAKLLGLRRVPLLNDLEATCYGILVMDPSDLEVLQAGTPVKNGAKAVIAAGTGLGECGMYWDGQRYLAIPGESGHADYAPHNALQCDLWKYLKTRHEFVSYEVVLSGRAFRELHEFLDFSQRHAEFDDPNVDPAPIITGGALSKSCPVCVQTLDLWVEIYGHEAGNLALRSMAHGGVYIGGGIAPKVLPKLRDGKFREAFASKSRFSSVLSQIPIYVLLTEQAPLLGAAHMALQSKV